MFCSHRGAQVPAQVKFCSQCGHTVPTAGPAAIPDRPVASATSVTTTDRTNRTMLLAVAGLILGGFVSFLMRPSAMLIGQLPFATVIPRGSMLSGIDLLLVPSAQASFNAMAIGAIIGTIAGLVASRSTGRHPSP